MSVSGWRPIATAPKDGSVVLLYWPTMGIDVYPQAGFNMGDEYGWELSANRDYGEVFPTHWHEMPAPPSNPLPPKAE